MLGSSCNVECAKFQLAVERAKYELFGIFLSKHFSITCITAITLKIIKKHFLWQFPFTIDDDCNNR